jgi:heme-degrading monooxygenase HmoA
VVFTTFAVRGSGTPGKAKGRRHAGMHARMTTMEGSPERLTEGLREIREDVLPQLQQQAGFKGFVVFDNRQSGELIGFSLWESEQAMQASEEVGERTRREAAETMSDTIAGVERYEVALFEVPSAGPVSGVTDTVGGVTDTVRGTTEGLLGGGAEKQR